MRKIKCQKCGDEFFENDSNPNIHYSNNINNMCHWCKVYESRPIGSYVQLKDGSYTIKK